MTIRVALKEDLANPRHSILQKSLGDKWSGVGGNVKVINVKWFAFTLTVDLTWSRTIPSVFFLKMWQIDHNQDMAESHTLLNYNESDTGSLLSLLL